ncbi:MAG: hypothetical protein M1300_12340 [Epsilonproteobacteria bacterium]|nr:hypothetical protein [Campylobacterota bacterium]
MGGFAGGDEGGYWDIDTLPASMDQQNDHTSKNTTGKNSNIEKTDTGYSIKAHARVKSLSGWIRVEELYDTISFVSCKCESFTLEGCDDIPLESNTIYQAYLVLNDFTNDSDILDYFSTHKVVVTKRIAPSAGFGGSSSDAAAFIGLVKEVCNLILTTDELAKIGSSITPDVPFFIHN